MARDWGLVPIQIPIGNLAVLVKKTFLVPSRTVERSNMEMVEPSKVAFDTWCLRRRGT